MVSPKVGCKSVQIVHVLTCVGFNLAGTMRGVSLQFTFGSPRMEKVLQLVFLSRKVFVPIHRVSQPLPLSNPSSVTAVLRISLG